MKKLVSILLAALFALTLTASAATIAKPGEDFYYLDQPGVLTEETKAEIYYNNVALEKACGGQIVVAVVNTLGNMTEDEYAYRMINEWQVGDSERQNGIVMLLAIQEDTYYTTVGAGIERFLEAADISDINYEYLEPDFAARDYDAGVSKTFRALFDRVADYYNADAAYTDGATLLRMYESEYANAGNYGGYAPTHERREEGSGLGMIILIVLIIVLLCALRPVVIPRYRGYGFFGGIFYPSYRRTRQPGPRPFGFSFGPRPGSGPRPGFGPRPGGAPRTGSPRPSGFSRPGGFGSGRPGGSFGGRSGGFGGGHGGGGGGRGAGAGRGR